MELPLSIPSPEHIAFEEICSEVDEFEPLPSVAAARHEPEPEREEETSFDGRILAGLVSPY